MKNKLMLLSISALLVLGTTQYLLGQVICATCPDNTVTGIKASAFGDGNNVSGAYSLVAGRNSKATRPYSYVIGSYSGAEGLSSITIGNQSFTTGDYSYVFGNNSLAEHEFSLALGHNLIASSGGFVIGNGKVDALLSNDLQNTLMIGFNSDKPTLFVSDTRYGSQSGNVGIGNITDPQAKLHILADVNEHATLKIETISNDRISQIDFGNYFLISAGKNENMKFYTPGSAAFAMPLQTSLNLQFNKLC